MRFFNCAIMSLPCPGVNAGEPGAHTRVLVESRFYVAGAWTSWSRHGDQWRAASKMHARLTLGRESTRYETSVSRLRLAANL